MKLERVERINFVSVHLSYLSRCELLTVIRFLYLRGETPVAIHRKFNNSYGLTSISTKNVRKWYGEFLNVRTNIHDEARNGKPFVSDDLQKQFESELREDRRITVRELE